MLLTATKEARLEFSYKEQQESKQGRRMLKPILYKKIKKVVIKVKLDIEARVREFEDARSSKYE